MRTLIILLSLALFFLTGLIIGIGHDDQANDDNPNVEEAVEQTGKSAEQQVIVEEELTERKVSLADEPEHFTQKAASFLESGVKAFYELIVGVTYELVQVFF